MPFLIAEGIIGFQNTGLPVAENQRVKRCAVNLRHAFQFITLMLDYH